MERTRDGLGAGLRGVVGRAPLRRRFPTCGLLPPDVLWPSRGARLTSAPSSSRPRAAPPSQPAPDLAGRSVDGQSKRGLHPPRGPLAVLARPFGRPRRTRARDHPGRSLEGNAPDPHRPAQFDPPPSPPIRPEAAEPRCRARRLRDGGRHRPHLGRRDPYLPRLRGGDAPLGCRARRGEYPQPLREAARPLSSNRQGVSIGGIPTPRGTPRGCGLSSAGRVPTARRASSTSARSCMCSSRGAPGASHGRK